MSSPSVLIAFVIIILCVTSYSFSFHADHTSSPSFRSRGAKIFASGEGTSNKPLSVEDIAGKWRIVRFGQNSPKVYNILEPNDKNFRDTTHKIVVYRVGGLGLDLAEYQEGNKDSGGLVLINDIIPNGNADKSGLFKIGDALIEVSGVGGNSLPTSLEGLNLDKTLELISQFSEFDSLEFKVKRIKARSFVQVEVVGPNGEYACDPLFVLSGYGSNLRTLLQANNIKMYDDRTARFDSPYQTGNCAGEGTCGTCVIAVMAGQNLMNDKVRVEDKALKSLGAPPNYRWSCRTAIAPRNDDEGIIKIKLRPQTQKW